MHAMYDDDDVGCEMILLYFGIKFSLVWVSYKKICGIRRWIDRSVSYVVVYVFLSLAEQ